MPTYKPSAYTGREPYIFISYAHKDSEKVLPIIDGLQKRGFRVWYDEGLEVGSSWGDMIEEHLYNCSCAVCFISQNFLNSQNCQDEIDYAKEIGKGPLIIYLETFEIPRGFLFRYNRFHALKYEDFTGNDHFLDKLCATAQIVACKDEAAAPPAPAKPASSVPVPPAPKKQANDFSIRTFTCKLCGYQGIAEGTATTASCPMCGSPLRLEPTPVAVPAPDPVLVDPKKLYEQASQYEWGRDGVRQDLKKAYELYLEAAQLGDARAQDCVGQMYFDGRIVARDLHEAMKWFQLSAAQKYAPAQLHKQLCQDKLNGRDLNYKPRHS